MHIQGQLDSNPGLWALDSGHPLLSHANGGDRTEISQGVEVQRGESGPGCQVWGTEVIIGASGILRGQGIKEQKVKLQDPKGRMMKD